MSSLRKLTLTLLSGFARKVRTLKESDLVQFEKQSENSITDMEIKQLSKEFAALSEENIRKYKQMAVKHTIKQLSYEGQDPSPNKLVNRPAKGVVWGLGGQLVLANRKVELQGVRDDPEEITKFLELLQVKNIYIHDWKNTEQANINRRRYSIVGSCFSAKHCWKTAIQLKNALNKHMLLKKRSRSTKKVDMITALMNGGKDDEWTMVEYKDFQVSLMTEEQREAADLEWKWNNPVDEAMVQKYAQMDRNKKKRRSQFQDFT